MNVASDQLHDVMHLQSLKAMYCEIIDDCTKDAGRAAARLNEIFTEDATADYGMGVLEGRDAVVGFVVNAISSRSDSAWHAIHTPRIEVNGDSGIGRWTVVARMRVKGAAAADTIIGRYVDEFRRTPGGWRISRVHFSRVE
jgi:ketosteroid isomerase-like protein